MQNGLVLVASFRAETNSSILCLVSSSLTRRRSALIIQSFMGEGWLESIEFQAAGCFAQPTAFCFGVELIFRYFRHILIKRSKRPTQNNMKFPDNIGWRHGLNWNPSSPNVSSWFFNLLLSEMTVTNWYFCFACSKNSSCVIAWQVALIGIVFLLHLLKYS